MHKDLYLLLPIELKQHPEHCSRQYWKWEDLVEQYLTSIGHTIANWHTCDGDSFGPLIRGVRIDGELYTYG